MKENFMSIFSKIKDGLRRTYRPTPEEKIEARAARVTNMYGQKDERRYAMYQLCQTGGHAGAVALMRRFQRKCENTTVDFEEKELCSDYLIEMGEDAVEPVKDFLRENDTEFNWPFRSLKGLIDDEALLLFIIELLESIGPDYVRDPERKEQLMLTAKSYKDERLARALLPYLADDNETIRFVACDSAIEHGYDFDVSALGERLFVEESQRILTHIAEAFKRNSWVVPVSDAEMAERFSVAGYTLDKSNRIV